MSGIFMKSKDAEVVHVWAVRSGRPDGTEIGAWTGHCSKNLLPAGHNDLLIIHTHWHTFLQTNTLCIHTHLLTWRERVQRFCIEGVKTYSCIRCLYISHASNQRHIQCLHQMHISHAWNDIDCGSYSLSFHSDRMCVGLSWFGLSEVTINKHHSSSRQIIMNFPAVLWIEKQHSYEWELQVGEQGQSENPLSQTRSQWCNVLKTQMDIISITSDVRQVSSALDLRAVRVAFTLKCVFRWVSQVMSWHRQLLVCLCIVHKRGACLHLMCCAVCACVSVCARAGNIRRWIKVLSLF